MKVTCVAIEKTLTISIICYKYTFRPYNIIGGIEYTKINGTIEIESSKKDLFELGYIYTINFTKDIQ